MYTLSLRNALTKSFPNFKPYSETLQRSSFFFFYFHRSMGSNGAGGETEGTWTSVMRQVQFPQILLISEN